VIFPRRTAPTVVIFGILWLSIPIIDNSKTDVFAANPPTKTRIVSKTLAAANAVATEVDQLILTDLMKGGITPEGRCRDEDFLRRVSLDITGHLPTPREVTLFVLDPHAEKRTHRIERLLESPDFGKNWSRYWRDVIYIPATEPRSRLSQGDFETWISDQWNNSVGWNITVSAMLTATGDVKGHPETALIFSQSGETEDIAAEACRIFLGIQIQCANCHDHPSDIWKREQFHELAAFFPRIDLRRIRTDNDLTYEVQSVDSDKGRGDLMHEAPERWIALLDRNRDQKVSKDEMSSARRGRGASKASVPPMKIADRIFELADSDKNGALTLAEIKAMPLKMKSGRGSPEHHMADLNDPASKGKIVEPKFFVAGHSAKQGLRDVERRRIVAAEFTASDNPWFARAIVNRMWCEMLGEGFYMPVDDMGPTRSARFPEALDVLCRGFVSNRYDPKWLVRTIANTQAYQRQVAEKINGEAVLPFASVTPIRLRADVVFNALLQVFGMDEPDPAEAVRGKMDAGPRAYQRRPRFVFDNLFAVDPSLAKEDITGNIPQSLFLMNSRILGGVISANGNSRLHQILTDNENDRDAFSELYLLMLAREPSRNELEICHAYVKDVGRRTEGFEDLMWSLLNSSEFISKR